MKKRTCKVCKKKFIPSPNMFLPPTCSNYECMLEYSNKHLAKKKIEVKKTNRKVLKKFNDSDISILKRLAQKLFNQYIRTRDKDLPCISCGHNFKTYIDENNKKHEARQRHAGHYKSQGGNSLWRYDEDNCHAQCSICNNHLSGNLVPYRENLTFKIGIERVEELESINTIKKWTKEELDEIITTYRKKLKDML